MFKTSYIINAFERQVTFIGKVKLHIHKPSQQRREWEDRVAAPAAQSTAGEGREYQYIWCNIRKLRCLMQKTTVYL